MRAFFVLCSEGVNLKCVKYTRGDGRQGSSLVTTVFCSWQLL